MKIKLHLALLFSCLILSLNACSSNVSQPTNQNSEGEKQHKENDVDKKQEDKSGGYQAKCGDGLLDPANHEYCDKGIKAGIGACPTEKTCQEMSDSVKTYVLKGSKSSCAARCEVQTQEIPPGKLNTVVGKSCQKNADCGTDGFCIKEQFIGTGFSSLFQNGYCSAKCEVKKEDNCPDGSKCGQFGGTNLCLATCSQDNDCRYAEGYVCNNSLKICISRIPECFSSSDCKFGESCEVDRYGYNRCLARKSVGEKKALFESCETDSDCLVEGSKCFFDSREIVANGSSTSIKDFKYCALPCQKGLVATCPKGTFCSQDLTGENFCAVECEGESGDFCSKLMGSEYVCRKPAEFSAKNVCTTKVLNTGSVGNPCTSNADCSFNAKCYRELSDGTPIEDGVCLTTFDDDEIRCGRNTTRVETQGKLEKKYVCYSNSNSGASQACREGFQEVNGYCKPKDAVSLCSATVPCTDPGVECKENSQNQSFCIKVKTCNKNNECPEFGSKCIDENGTKKCVIPKVTTKALGSECDADNECDSGLCLKVNGDSEKGICTVKCTNAPNECDGASVCAGFGIRSLGQEKYCFKKCNLLGTSNLCDGVASSYCTISEVSGQQAEQIWACKPKKLSKGKIGESCVDDNDCGLYETCESLSDKAKAKGKFCDFYDVLPIGEKVVKNSFCPNGTGNISFYKSIVSYTFCKPSCTANGNECKENFKCDTDTNTCVPVYEQEEKEEVSGCWLNPEKCNGKDGFSCGRGNNANLEMCIETSKGTKETGERCSNYDECSGKSHAMCQITTSENMSVGFCTKDCTEDEAVCSDTELCVRDQTTHLGRCLKKCKDTASCGDEFLRCLPSPGKGESVCQFGKKRLDISSSGVDCSTDSTVCTGDTKCVFPYNQCLAEMSDFDPVFYECLGTVRGNFCF